MPKFQMLKKQTNPAMQEVLEIRQEMEHLRKDVKDLRYALDEMTKLLLKEKDNLDPKILTILKRVVEEYGEPLEM